MIEQTLILIKPDGVCRGKIGAILRRFERIGLKVVALKMVAPSMNLAKKHYPSDRKELWRGIAQKTLKVYKDLGISAVERHGTDDLDKLGSIIREWLQSYISSGPVCSAVIEGPHAISLVRKVCGNTLPLYAEPGTIRGDFAYDSPAIANYAGRAVKNLVHASGNKKEADYEIQLWFSKGEIVSYKRAEEDVME